MAYLWSRLVVMPLIAFSTAVFAVISNLVSLFNPSPTPQLKVARAWARSLLSITGVKVEVEGLEQIHAEGSYVFASNHLSYMDTPVVLASIPAQFLFLAKSGLFRIPFLGWHLKRAGHVPVPREDPRAALRTLGHAAELLHAGRSTLIFPEGGRSATGELDSFKDGAAFLAIRAQVPLVPIALIGTRAILPMHSLTFHRGRVKVRIGRPIPTEGMTTHQRGELTASARQKIVEMLERSTG
jgi:1-acyl-sn-glycerol-3-phosphate acyltransferase